ncbi:MAG: diguanylate cyclase [Cyanobacteria bacterium P01_E01_bin.6]
MITHLVALVPYLQILDVHPSYLVILKGYDDCDGSGRILYCNSPVADFMGRSPEELIGQCSSAFWTKDECAKYSEDDRRVIANQEQEGPIFESFVGANGEEVFLKTWAYPYGKNSVLKITLDITDQEKAERALRELAEQHRVASITDPLTKLYNRAYLDQVVRQELTRRDRQFAILFIDLDRFKQINDELGHKIGDSVLIEVAGKISSCLRYEDLLFRLGGDEFVVLLRMDHEMVPMVADRISRAIAQPLLAANNRTLSGSIGIAIADVDSTFDSLMQFADDAMYRCKGIEKPFCFSSPEMQSEALLAVEYSDALQRAFEREEFELYYQEIISADTLKVSSLEALVRWNHPEKGLIMPGLFLPHITKNGLMGRLTQWVSHQAAQDVRSLPDGITISINVSPHLDAGVMRDVLLGLPCGVGAEVTEDCLLSERAIAALAEFRTIGGKLSLDDIGTGCSSLAEMLNDRWSWIKIDRSFLSYAKLIPGLVSMILASGSEAVLEGVEDLPGLSAQEIIAIARREGIKYLQGYHFGMPRPLMKFRF